MEIKKNITLNILYQLLLIIIPLITAPYTARTIGAEGVGEYSYYYSIAYYFMLIIMLGLNNYGNRTIAYSNTDREKLSKTFWNIYAFQILWGMVVGTIYILFVLISDVSSRSKMLMVINVLYIISAILDINWFYFGIEKFKLTVGRNSIIRILTVMAIITFVKNKEDVFVYAFIMAVSVLLTQIVLWSFLHKYVDWYKPTWREIRKHIKPNLILFIPVIAVSLYKIMDKIMIGLLSTTTQTGFYEYSEKIINIPTSLITAVGTVMLPRISNLIGRGEEEKSAIYIRDSLEISNFVSIALAFGLAAISENFIPVFLGKEFESCIAVTMCLSMSIFFVAWANVIRTQYLIPRNKNYSYTISVIAGAVSNLIVNALLIPRYGAVGAAIGTLIAEALVMTIQTYSVRKELNIRLYFKDGIEFFFIGFIMFACVRKMGNLMTDKIILLILQVIIGGIIYLLMTALFYWIFRRKRLKYYIQMLKK